MTKRDALQLGLNIVGVLFPQIGHIESVAKAVPGLKGKAKEDAAIALTLDGLSLIETIVDKDVLKDEEVAKAVRGVIQAVVALQNVLVKA